MTSPRRFLVPKALVASGLGVQATLDEMEHFASHTGPTGSWARKVLARENSRILDDVLGESTRLPRGVLASAVETGGAEVVVSLVSHEGQVWAPDTGWVASALPGDTMTCDLDDNDVAFVIRALREGATGVVMRASMPLAFIAAGVDVSDSPLSAGEVPQGSHVVAIVDALDKDAVLEALAIAPGPKVYRRHDGKWVDDPQWVSVLSSVRPPPMVKLSGDLVASVGAQIDQATKGKIFVPFEQADAVMYQPVAASSYVTDLENEAAWAGIQQNMALIAVAGRELSPKDMASTEKLRRYWLYGEGAAKIRWFTPGAWRRCYRNLVKYLGPKMTPGYCTNLSQRLGGHGVATHVGD